MLKNIRKTFGRYLINIPGWRTDRKIVVFESDDWGSIRMPSKSVYKKCLDAGYRVDQIAYERFDSLASEDDLELLFEVLSTYTDKMDNPAVFTANILTSNPDFDKIKKNGYQEYFYEMITDTFKKYPNHSNCLNLWKNGKENGVFYPQSHGREHLNVSLFMRSLQAGDKDALFGFNHEMPGCIPKENPGRGNKYVESLRYNSKQDKREKLSIIIKGLKLFESLMGYYSITFIPPNYIWSSDYDESMFQEGVLFYQGHRKMKEPVFDGSYKFHNRILGKKNKFGQRCLVRNATFEPAMHNSGSDPVNRCLKDISIAFRMNKPAIISSHRLNYVGFIDERNRDNSLRKLENLLSQIRKKWPEIEFLSSVELGEMISE